MGIDGGLMDLPKTRAKAKVLGSTRYMTGKPCPHGHVADRRTSNGACIACCSSAQALQEKREWARAWRLENLELDREKSRQYARANTQRAVRKVKEWVQKNRERSNATKKRWADRNPAIRAAGRMKRIAAELNATPAWLTQAHFDEIKDIYKQAKLAAQLTGVPHHVDHIEPLNGMDRCGLHVPWNLQVLTAEENVSKGNRPIKRITPLPSP